MDEVVDVKLHPITKLRGDATCLFLYPDPHPKRRGPQRKYDGQVNCQDLCRFEALGPLEERDHVHLYTAIVWHVSLKRKLCGVVRVHRKDLHKPRYIVLASTDVELDGRRLVAFYVARFQIEFLFRDSKQFTGLAACQSRAEAVLDLHFNTALGHAQSGTGRRSAGLASPSAPVFSMASWKQCHFNERLLDFFIESLALDPTWVKKHPGYDELRTYGAIAA
jgi:hypothetical protein